MRTIPKLLLSILALVPCTNCSASLFLDVDLIDEVFKTGGTNLFTGAMSYDVFNIDLGANTMALGADGIDDIEIIITQTYSGMQNGVDYSFSTFRNGTGVGSRIQSAGAPNINNPGTLNSQTIEIRFLGQIQVEADAQLLASVSSANTIAGGTTGNTNAWETSSLQFLDVSHQEFTAFSSRNYVDEQTSRGIIGAGTYAADGDTQDNVGTVNAISDADGNEDDNSPVLDFGNAGLAAGTRIGGFRFTQILTDTRGTSDTGVLNYTATINELNIRATAAPEPSSAISLMLGLGAFCIRRKRRKLPRPADVV